MITVDGGHFKLTNADQNTSISMTPGNGFAVKYESGSIVWSGVADPTAFNVFKNGSYTTWVNAGSITSSRHTNAELNNGLSFVEGVGAVLAIAVPTDFEIWLSDNSLEGATFEGDSNQDGLANGLHWALGLTTSESPAPHLLTFASSTPSSATYTIGLPTGGSAGDLTVSYTPDLMTAFTPLASGAVNVGNPIPAGTTGTVTITLPAGVQGFLKMSAVAP
jgi:hypothetical protein